MTVSLSRSDAADRLAPVQAAYDVIKELNAHLDRHGPGLSQMGGYDHQTVAGVMSTSTHCSGVTCGPLNDYAHSLDMVVSEGRIVRIERAAGPTDRASYDATTAAGGR